MQVLCQAELQPRGGAVYQSAGGTGRPLFHQQRRAGEAHLARSGTVKIGAMATAVTPGAVVILKVQKPTEHQVTASGQPTSAGVGLFPLGVQHRDRGEVDDVGDLGVPLQHMHRAR